MNRRAIKFFMLSYISLFVGSVSASSDCLFLTDGSGYAEGTCNALSVGASKRTDKSFYASLVWSFGQKQASLPDLVLGFRNLSVNSNNHVSGGDLSARFRYSQQVKLDSFRLSYLGGERTLIGNIGAGYSFTQNSPILTGAIQGSNMRLGSDFSLARNNFTPYVEINSAGVPKKVSATSGGACTSGLSAAVVSNNENLGNLGPGIYTLPVNQGGLPVGTLACFNP